MSANILDFLDGQVSTLEAQKLINLRYDELYYIRKDTGERKPYVCTFCDEFLLHRLDINYVTIDMVRKRHKLFEWKEFVEEEDRIVELEQAFEFHDVENKIKGDRSFLKGMALSPRGIINKKDTRGSRWGFSACGKCKFAIDSGHTPLYSIVNQNFIGNAPTCITELTEIERALVTPVRGYGWTFTYTGGKMMNLKGTLCFMRVEERKIARAAVQLEKMGLTKHVLILLTGKMTKGQRAQADNKHKIRTDKILAAVDWLIANHKAWKHVDLGDIRQELDSINPIVVDNSKEVESENANIEEQELFTCYFPDGAATSNAGGFDEPGAFQKYVEDMQKQNFDVEVRLRLEHEGVRGGSNIDELVMANLLQFPYGIGGMNERRLKADGKFTDTVELSSFLKHLTLISQPNFQTPLFQLVMYTMISRQRLLKRSRLQLKDKRSVAALAGGIDAKDLRRAITGRQRGDRSAGSLASRQLLKSVDAISKALPHTNEASRLARSSAEALQHYFGIGTIWLTINYDDENSLIMQVLSDRKIDDDTPLHNLSDEDLSKRFNARRKIRLEFPGLAAMNFEMLINIAFEEVIGWDMRHNRSTNVKAYFGLCEAVCMALEEQGRKSIHGHITAWIQGFDEVRRMLFFGSKAQKQMAIQITERYSAKVATTSLFGALDGNRLLKCLDHECIVRQNNRRLAVVNDQTLRELRHKQGYDYHKGKFAYCELCGKEWTYEKMVELVIRRESGIEGMVQEDDPEEYILPKARMRSHIVEFQKKRNVDAGTDTPTMCINANYQHHNTRHLTGCFKCKKLDKTKHTCGPNCECRFRLPDLPRQTPSVKNLSKDGEAVTWFKWNGDAIAQPLVQIQPKRHKLDLFQNVSCPAISESKFSCNSNIAIITDGPIAQYNIKYQNKGNESEENKEYEGVQRSIRKVDGRLHEDDRREAMRMICRATFAHNTTNVIGAPFASYLTRHDSRFYFSHPFALFPLDDMIRILNDADVSGTLQYTPFGGTFFENQAMHYLCRPGDLEDCTAKFFYENYQVKYLSKKRKRDDELMPLIADTGHYEHPSVDENGEVQQGVEELEEMHLIKVPQWKFPDTAKFGDILTTCSEAKMTRDMDTYARNMLILFMPFRSVEDFVPEQPCQKYHCLHRLQEIYELEKETGELEVFQEENLQFLQNIQNAAYNSLRFKVTDDELKQRTHAFTTDEMKAMNLEEANDEEDDSVGVDPYEVILDFCEDEVDTTDEDPHYLPQHMSDFSFIQIRNEGSNKCGYNKDIPIPPVAENLDDWIKFGGNSTNRNTRANGGNTNSNQAKTSINNIVNLLLRRKQSRQRQEVFKRNPQAEVIDADGSVESILDWADAAGLDEIQKRAFECIISSFILTYYDDAEEEDEGGDDDTSRGIRAKFRRSKKHLLKLKGGNNSQLICLLHGPGGSGKSTVINLVTAYAQDFCKCIGMPFTERTIVITAMSGVAATLLHGETTHKALGLNCRPGSLASKDDMIEAWSDARLVIIDEISFASEEDFDAIYRNLSDLMRNPFKPYGNLNVVFAGDYSQLEPAGRNKNPIYATDGCASFNNQLTTYIELNGHHRFRKDPAWGQRLQRFREGQPTLEDIRLINGRCLVSPEHMPPPGTQITSYTNKDRDAVNCAIFEEYCKRHHPGGSTMWKGAMVILMDSVCMENGEKKLTAVRSNHVLKTFWSTVGEAGASQTQRQRVDPVLKLYPNCPLMFTENKCVAEGQANGSRVHLSSVNVRPGERPFAMKLKCGAIVQAFRASQILSIQVQHEFPDIMPNKFEVEAKDWHMKPRFNLHGEDMYVNMSGTQFPLISNSCTTGHKLQGYTAETLTVNDWRYKENWQYVVLSRVTTMLGLYLLKPLSEDLKKYEMPKKMLNMIAKFKETIGISMIDDIDYEKMVALEKSWETLDA